MATKMEDSGTEKDPGQLKPVKILILGDFGIGKTTFIKTYLELDDIRERAENIFEVYRTRIEYNGNEVDVELIDIKPGPSAAERREFYPTGVNAILMCFSIAHFESLKCVYNLWIHEARAHYGRLVPIFLVGLRSDVRSGGSTIEIRSRRLLHDRMVIQSEAEIIHTNYYFYGDYMECSKLDRMSIVNVINKAFFAAMED